MIIIMNHENAMRKSQQYAHGVGQAGLLLACGDIADRLILAA